MYRKQAMANDAKLGLVLGVAVVLVIGLVFFRNDPASARIPAATAAQQSSHLRQNPVASPSASMEIRKPH